MIICRKCQRHHPDSVGAGPCPCGANLKRDGIALVQSLDTAPPEPPPPADLDDLPPLGEPEPATAAPAATDITTERAPSPQPAADARPDEATTPATPRSPASDPAPDAPSDAATTSQTTPPSSAAKRLTSALKGRSRRRAGSATPKPTAKPDEPGEGTTPRPTPRTPTVTPSSASDTTAPTAAPQRSDAVASPTAPTRPDDTTAPAPPAGSRPRGRAPATSPAAPPDDTDDVPTVGPVAGDRPAPDTPGDRPAGDRGEGPAAAGDATTAGGGPAAGGVGGVGAAADVETKGSGPTLRRPRRRAGSVNPRDLIAAQQDADAPNVGVAPAEPAAAANVPTALDVTEVDADPTPRPPRAGERACPTCQEANPDTRRFCLSCGTAMPAAGPDKAEGDAAGADGQQPKGKAARTWRQRAKAAGHNRMRYTSGLSRQAKAKAIMALFGFAAVVVALVVGPGRERVLALVGRGSEGTSPASAELVDGEEVVGLPAADVRDDDNLTGVAIADDDRERARLVLTLDEPTDVGKLLIAPGLPDDAEEGPLFQRPSRVQVCSDSGSCQEVTLDDATSLQSRKVSLGDDVSTIELSILDVHEVEYTTYPLAVISEVRVKG